MFRREKPGSFRAFSRLQADSIPGFRPRTITG